MTIWDFKFKKKKRESTAMSVNNINTLYTTDTQV